jgi:hypothetical protein
MAAYSCGDSFGLGHKAAPNSLLAAARLIDSGTVQAKYGANLVVGQGMEFRYNFAKDQTFKSVPKSAS